MDFNIDLHPTLNFLVGNLTIATLAQAPSLFVQCIQLVFPAQG
jgi:hypothetical protein